MGSSHSDAELTSGNELVASIGVVMTTWQGIEYTVCETYLSFFQAAHRDVPSVAYHAIRTFDARLTVVTSLVQYFCSVEQKTEWDGLLKKIRKRAKVRNAIAHGMATLFGKAPNRKWGVGHNPYDLENFSGSSKENDYYSAKELDECSQGMAALTKELDMFRAQIEADVALQTKLASQQNSASNNQRRTNITVSRSV